MSNSCSFFISTPKHENIIARSFGSASGYIQNNMALSAPRYQTSLGKKLYQRFCVRFSTKTHQISKYNSNMDWLTGGKQGEAKRLISQLSDVTKRERAAQDLLRLGPEVLTPLLEALQTKDPDLLPLYQQILARIPTATPTL